MRPRARVMAAAVLALASTPRPARASGVDCGRELVETLFGHTELARSWSVVRILVATADGSMPEIWAAQPDEAQDPGTAALGATPEERWDRVYAQALALFHRYALACDAKDFEVSGLLAVGIFEAPTPMESLRDYASTHAISSAQLSPLVGVTGAVAQPRPLQFSLSQLVTQGQPAIAPSISGSPWGKSPSAVARHLTLAANAIVVSPTRAAEDAAEASGGEPVFASADLYVSTDNAPRAADWLREVNARVGSNAADLASLRTSAMVVMVRRYKDRAPATPQAQSEALRTAHDSAQEFLHRRVVDYYAARYIEPLEDARSSWLWSLGLRARVTPDATWVPELPDLLSAALEGRASYRVASLETGALDAIASASASYSGVSRLEASRLSDADVGDASHTILLDAGLGVGWRLPQSQGLPGAQLAAAALGRYRPATGSASRARELGASILLEVPVSASVALVGSYVLRCDRECVQTSGLTLSVTKTE